MVTNNIFDSIFKNRWVRLSTAVTVVLLIISAIFRALTVPPPPASTVITNNRDTQLSFKFSDSLSLDIPEKLQTYSSTEVVDINKLRDELAKKLDMEPYRSLINVWQDKSKTYMLMTENNGQYLAYKKDVYFEDPQPSTQLPLNKEKIQQFTREFIEAHTLFRNFAFSDVRPMLLSAEGTVKAPSEAEANVFEFDVYTLIDNIPYVVGDKNVLPGFVKVNANGEINRLNFYPVSFNFQKVEEYSSLPLYAVKNNVNSGLVTIITSETEEEVGVTDLQAVEVIFDTAALEYRQNTQNGFILPYVRFTGTGKNSKGEELIVEAISPAVKVE